MITRRGLLIGALAAPALIKASSLLYGAPKRLIVPPEPGTTLVRAQFGAFGPDMLNHVWYEDGHWRSQPVAEFGPVEKPPAAHWVEWQLKKKARRARFEARTFAREVRDHTNRNAMTL